MGDRRPGDAAPSGDADRFLSLLERPRGGRIEIVAMGVYGGRPFAFVDRVWDQHVLNVILAGTLRVDVEGAAGDVQAGGLIWVPPGVRHSFRILASRPFRMLNCRFRLIGGNGRSVGFPGAGFRLEDATIHRHLCELAFDDLQRGHPRRLDRFRRILYLLYTDLIETREPRAALDRRRRQALAAFARAGVARRPSTAALARLVGLSEDYFRRLFHRTYGIAPRRWLLRERMRQAAVRLIEAPRLPIGAVAAEFGYAEIFPFSRQFKDVMGMSPRAYRARHG